jgi:hypothetical protein
MTSRETTLHRRRSEDRDMTREMGTYTRCSFPKLMSYSHLKCHPNVINDKKVGKTRLVDLIAIVGFYTLALTDMRRWEMRSLL